MSRSKTAGQREAILDAAFRVFGSRGFSGTAIRDVAEAAEVAVGSIYTYFPSKEELFRLTVQRGWNAFLEEVGRIVTADFEQALDYIFVVLRDALPLLRGMLFEAQQRDLLHEYLDELVRILDGFLAGAPGNVEGREGRRTFLRINVYGVLLSAALTRDEELDGEIAAIKDHLLALARGRRGGAP